MVDVASIVIAIISLLGSLLSASIAGWITFYSDERKRLSETEKLIAKYRDPLLLAAQDLQSRLYNITDQHLLSWVDGNDDQRKNLIRYTCFIVGEYMSWTHILRRQAQFLRFSTEKANSDFTRLLERISGTFSTDDVEDLGIPFSLWRGQQMALGEIMTIKDDDELYCMGFSEFDSKWDTDEIFRAWFQPLVAGLSEVATAYHRDMSNIPDHRLRRIQHLMLDLIAILDPKSLRVDTSRNKPCSEASPCPCSLPKCQRARLSSVGEGV